MNKSRLSRRHFIKQSAIASGLVALHPYGSGSSQQKTESARLPGEVWIATISQMDIFRDNAESMVDTVLNLVEDITGMFNPDIVCLPEVFPTSNIRQKLDMREKHEIHSKILPKFSSLAKKHHCYMICPVYTSVNGKYYNSGVVFDREGFKMGEYHKIHLTKGEISSGLTPGSLDPAIFEADFGKFGIQICYDIEWDDGWKALKKKGAQIVFWPSAFAGGKMINSKAWRNQYFVVTSTRKNTSKICDISGETLAQTDFWESNKLCSSVNLEKAFVPVWPYKKRFDEIRKKYGRKVRITNFEEEGFTVIESLSPELFIADLLQEYDFKTEDQLLREAEMAQLKARKG